MVAWPAAEMPAEGEGGDFNDLLVKQAEFRAKKKEDCCVVMCARVFSSCDY